MVELTTSLPAVTLIKPDVERDAPLSVKWLGGEQGRKTLKLMGVTDKDNKPTTLKKEQQRVNDFLSSTNQVTWMIQFNGGVVGAIWVDLEDTQYLAAPSVHLMIGDPKARGYGVGSASLLAVINYLKQKNKDKYLYSRYLTDNGGSAALLQKLGFEKLEESYRDKDGLSWQNVRLSLGR